MRTFKPWQAAIRKIREIAKLGLHPSLHNESNLGKGLSISLGTISTEIHEKNIKNRLHAFSLNYWKDEKDWLEQISELVPIVHSRQHYIHVLMPETYRQLIQLGILHDWSMGYAQDLGYRAGTGLPFLWYDLLEEKTTTLCIHPFSVMDVTLKNYRSMLPEEAKRITFEMKCMCAVIGVPFTFIVHNESLSEKQGWEGWHNVFLSWRDELSHVFTS
jgi:hypothetical protein